MKDIKTFFLNIGHWRFIGTLLCSYKIIGGKKVLRLQKHIYKTILYSSFIKQEKIIHIRLYMWIHHCCQIFFFRHSLKKLLGSSWKFESDSEFRYLVNYKYMFWWLILLALTKIWLSILDINWKTFWELKFRYFDIYMNDVKQIYYL